MGERPVSAMASCMTAASIPLPAISRVSANLSLGASCRPPLQVTNRREANLSDNRSDVEQPLHAVGAGDGDPHPSVGHRPDDLPSVGLIPCLKGDLPGRGVDAVEHRQRPGAPTHHRRLDRQHVEPLAPEDWRLAGWRQLPGHRWAPKDGFGMAGAVCVAPRPPSPIFRPPSLERWRTPGSTGTIDETVGDLIAVLIHSSWGR